MRTAIQEPGQGLSKIDYQKRIARLENFSPLESDWKELLRWVLSVEGGERWKNHILIILIEIVRKDVEDYQDFFIKGRGTAIQSCYTKDLRHKIQSWIERIDCFMSCEGQVEIDLQKSSVLSVAQNIRHILADSLACNTSPGKNHSSEIANFPYYSMLGAVSSIKKNCDYYIAKIEESKKIDASLSLLLTFTRHYSGIVEKFNRTFSSLPDIYHQQILGVKSKPVVQDKTYVVITLSSDEQQGFILPKDTLFEGGTTATGEPLFYHNLRDEYISPVKISQTEYGSVKTGWMLASSVLLLSEGRREINISFQLNKKVVLSDTLSRTLASLFTLQISTAEGWIARDIIPVYAKEENRLTFSLTLHVDDSAVVPCIPEIHQCTTIFPVVRIQMKQQEEEDTDILRTLFTAVKIHVKVMGLRRFDLYNELGQLDTMQPFYPFGTQAERGSWFMFGCDELSKKQWKLVQLEGVWNKLPQTSGGYAEVYRWYSSAINNQSFKVKTEWQHNQQWKTCRESPLSLFTTDDQGKLKETVVITFNKDNTTFSTETDYRSKTDFFRVTLDAPSVGFGMETYRQQFAEVMMYNSRRKEKHHKEVPSAPLIPLLADISLTYEAEAESGGIEENTKVHLYPIVRPSDHTAITFSTSGKNKAYPLFDTVAIDKAFYLGLQNVTKEQTIRMYVVLKPLKREELTDNPVKHSPTHWQYYHGKGEWITLSESSIIQDTTQGFTFNGHIEIEVPGDNLYLDADKVFWLRICSAQSSKIESIYINCLLVIAKNGDGHPLAAGTIQTLQTQDDRVAEISQPLSGFGGRVAEKPKQTFIRQSSRIAHRNRAVTGRDYEQAVLEQFHDIEKVYCFSTQPDDELPTAHVIVISGLVNNVYSLTAIARLTEIRNYLLRYISPMVKLEVSNPVMQIMKFVCCAIKKEHVRNDGVIIRRLTRRINQYFASWLYNGILPELDVQYSYKELHARLANDEDIVRLTKLTVNGKSIGNVDVDADDLYIKGDKPWYIFMPDIEIHILSGVGIGYAAIEKDFTIQGKKYEL